jgi:hypothetical protein
VCLRARLPVCVFLFSPSFCSVFCSVFFVVLRCACEASCVLLLLVPLLQFS